MRPVLIKISIIRHCFSKKSQNLKFYNLVQKSQISYNHDIYQNNTKEIDFPIIILTSMSIKLAVIKHKYLLSLSKLYWCDICEMVWTQLWTSLKSSWDRSTMKNSLFTIKCRSHTGSHDKMLVTKTMTICTGCQLFGDPGWMENGVTKDLGF